jgi:hypothetical protein
VGVEVVFSVVGRDDIFGAGFSSPPLTTPTVPIQPAGRVAVAMVLPDAWLYTVPRRRGLDLLRREHYPDRAAGRPVQPGGQVEEPGLARTRRAGSHAPGVRQGGCAARLKSWIVEFLTRLTLRGIMVIVVWAGVVVLGLVLLAPDLWTYVRGSTTTAHVDDCRSRQGAGRTGTVWDCYGSWTVDGVRHTGEINGARRTDEGKDIQVRANGSQVAPMSTPTTARNTTAILIGIGVGNHVLVLTRLSRSRRATTTT